MLYLYCTNQIVRINTQLTSYEYRNDWIHLHPDRTLVVSAHYAWNGCSPKFRYKDMVFGTPEGVLNPESGYSKTYLPSLCHDALYQFSKELPFTRKEVDQEFLRLLQKEEFRAAKLYYWAVRVFGYPFWVD